MITIKAEQEHYCLVTDGGYWTVVERRAGKYHPLGNCARPGIALEDPEAATFFAAGLAAAFWTGLAGAFTAFCAGCGAGFSWAAAPGPK